jgi:hypothetical protein
VISSFSIRTNEDISEKINSKVFSTDNTLPNGSKYFTIIGKFKNVLKTFEKLEASY